MSTPVFNVPCTINGQELMSDGSGKRCSFSVHGSGIKTVQQAIDHVKHLSRRNRIDDETGVRYAYHVNGNGDEFTITDIETNPTKCEIITNYNNASKPNIDGEASQALNALMGRM